MLNKAHKIVDDSWDMKGDDMGGASHTRRVAIITNSVMISTPVIIHDISKLVVDNPKVNISLAKKCFAEPILLDIRRGDLEVAVLMHYDDDNNLVQCFPFSNTDDGKHWWSYEVGFDIIGNGVIHARPVHPMVNHLDPTKEMMEHVEALAIIVESFLVKYSSGEVCLREVDGDLSKINKKRLKNKRAPIRKDWEIVDVSKDSVI